MENKIYKTHMQHAAMQHSQKGHGEEDSQTTATQAGAIRRSDKVS